MSDYKKGDNVYIRAVVDRAPQEGAKLYRLVTEKGTVVWARPEELIGTDEIGQCDSE